MWTRSWLKMAWDWQLPVAETANLPSCLLSVVWKKPSWRPLECCPWPSCQRQSGHQANSCWTGAENRVNHNPWFMSGMHRGWCQVFFTSLLFLSICYSLYCPLPLPSCSSYQGKHFNVPGALLLFGLETLYTIALTRKCVDASQNGQPIQTWALEMAVVLYKAGWRSFRKSTFILDFQPRPPQGCGKVDFSCLNHLLHSIVFGNSFKDIFAGTLWLVHTENRFEGMIAESGKFQTCWI